MIQFLGKVEVVNVYKMTGTNNATLQFGDEMVKIVQALLIPLTSIKKSLVQC